MAAVDVNMTGIVKVNTSLRVRNRPSLTGSVIGSLQNGFSLTITKKDGAWYYATNATYGGGGWVHGNYLTLTNNATTQTSSLSKEEQERLAREQEEKNKKSELEKQLSVMEAHLNETSLSDKEIIDSLIVNNLNGIYGIPYQFMDTVDPRLGDSVMGRKYSDKIIAKMPLLCITPGKVAYMSNFSKREQKGILAKLMSNDADTEINDIIKKNGRYFTFEFNYKQYFDYVNGLCRTGARFLNIHNVELDIGGKKAKAKNFDWANALNKNLKATLTSQEFIAFYMDSTDSVSEEFSNETTQSQLASTVNEAGGSLARELGFLLGAGAEDITKFMDQSKITDAMESIDLITKKYLNGSGLLSNIAGNFKTIASGGKLLFPEIWADSSFSKSFDITIKLRTPDSDVVSWYVNIYVPLCHLIALAAGHQTDNSNGYYSPFLIRAYYKGLFNVDMGIVTSMSITKGKESAWNIDGLPTEIDVNLSIKDLYNMLSIVPGNEPKNFVNNNILMDYIANTCGININQMDLLRSIEIYYILTTDRVRDLPNNVLRKFQDAIDTYGMELYNGVLNKFLI